MNKFDNEVLSNGENKRTDSKEVQHKKMTKKQIMDYIGFARFKNRLYTLRVVKTLLATLAVAFITCGVTLILTKLDVWDVSPWLSIPFMLLAGAITFLCVFLPLSVNDKKLARTLDEKFSLKERMQTSYENADNHSAMSVLLRQDLKSKTDQISTNKIKARGLAVYIIAAVIGVATLITGLAIRQKKEEAPPPPPPPAVEVWELTEEQEIALNGFAAAVRESDMVSPAREELVAKIEELIISLKATKNEEVATEKILLCVTEMDLITYNTGSSGAIYNALIVKETAFARELARALTRKEQPAYVGKMTDALTSLKHRYDGLEVPTEEQQKAMKIDTLDLLTSVVKDVEDALEESGVDENDTLYKMIDDLLTLDDGERMGLSLVLDIFEIIGYEPAKGEIENLWSTLLVTRDIYLELSRQRVNYDAGYGASDGIRELFGLPVIEREDLSSERPKGEDGEGSEGDENKDGAGGYGPGEILGTDELVYDKDYQKTIITYKIYSEYKEIMEKLYGEEIDGEIKLPPEIEKYLDLLLNGYEGEK